MAKGEMFLSGKVQKKKFSNEPIPAADYDLKILGDTAEIRTAEVTKERPNPVPYVSFALEAMGSAKEEGQRNRRVYHSLFLNMTPRKDGSLSPQMADQVKGLADALGDQLKASIITVNGVKCISAKEVKQWIENHTGEVVRGHVKIQRGTSEYPDPKNVIAEFFEKDDASEESEEEESEDEETEETDEAEEDSDDDSDDEDEDEADEEDEDEDTDDEDDLKKAAKKPAKKKAKK